jgi:hypothetical protein
MYTLVVLYPVIHSLIGQNWVLDASDESKVRSDRQPKFRIREVLLQLLIDRLPSIFSILNLRLDGIVDQLLELILQTLYLFFYIRCEERIDLCKKLIPEFLLLVGQLRLQRIRPCFLSRNSSPGQQTSSGNLPFIEVI